MESQKFNFDKSSAISKQERRLHLKTIRDRLSEKRRQKGSVEACCFLLEATDHARLVLSFASFGSEINLWPLNEALCREGRLVLPRLNAAGQLSLFYVSHLDQLEPHRFGILEPNPETSDLVSLSNVEIALIPGLGFDLLSKHRLGYGLGAYDHLLRPRMIGRVWGIGFMEQGVIDLPYDGNDVPVDELFLF